MLAEITIRKSQNPFTPHQPVKDPAKFAGRRDSLSNAIYALFNRKNIFVSGERGIGKTSLANQLAYMTEGDTQLLERLGIRTEDDYEFCYLVIDHRCSPGQRVDDIVSGLMLNLQYKLSSKERLKDRKLKHTVDLKFYKMQLEETYEKKLSNELINRFVIDIEELQLTLISLEYNGFCFFIDELDDIDRNTPIASFLKPVMEKLNADGYFDVCFIIAGHESYISVLFEQHPSSLRMFENINIKPMSDEECLEIIDKTLEKTGDTFSVGHALWTQRPQVV